MSLFRDSENLPPFLAVSLPLVSQEEQLCLFELLHPIHRLLDFWCVKQGSNATPPTLISEWSDECWQKAWIHLNPQMKTEQVREHLTDSVRRYQPWQISQYAFSLKESAEVDSSLAACLLPLWESEQPFSKMVEHWLTLSPIDPITLEPTDPQAAARDLKRFLIDLDKFPYLLVEIRE